MTALVHRQPVALIGLDHEPAHRSQQELVASLVEVTSAYGVRPVARRQESCLVHQVLEVRTREPGRTGSDAGQVHVGGQRHPAGMNTQDGLTVFPVRQVQRDVPVESARPQQGGIQDIGAVGGGQHNHCLSSGESVELGEYLIQGLLALVVTTSEACPPSAANAVELIDENDAGRVFPGRLEEVADTGSPHAHKHLDELRSGDGVELDSRLSRERSGQQSLARSGRPHEQHPARYIRAKLAKLERILQVVHEVRNLSLGAFLARDVGEGDPGTLASRAGDSRNRLSSDGPPSPPPTWR
jgi:hypothetical protein